MIIGVGQHVKASLANIGGVIGRASESITNFRIAARFGALGAAVHCTFKIAESDIGGFEQRRHFLTEDGGRIAAVGDARVEIFYRIIAT